MPPCASACGLRLKRRLPRRFPSNSTFSSGPQPSLTSVIQAITRAISPMTPTTHPSVAKMRIPFEVISVGENPDWPPDAESPSVGCARTTRVGCGPVLPPVLGGGPPPFCGGAGGGCVAVGCDARFGVAVAWGGVVAVEVGAVVVEVGAVAVGVVLVDVVADPVFGMSDAAVAMSRASARSVPGASTSASRSHPTATASRVSWRLSRRVPLCRAGPPLAAIPRSLPHIHQHIHTHARILASRSQQPVPVYRQRGNPVKPPVTRALSAAHSLR